MVEEHNGASVVVQAAGVQCVRVTHPGPSLSLLSAETEDGRVTGPCNYTHTHTHARMHTHTHTHTHTHHPGTLPEEERTFSAFLVKRSGC